LQIEPWLDLLYTSNDLTDRFPGRATSLKLIVEDSKSREAPAVNKPTNAVFTENNLCAGLCFYEEGRFYSANDGDYWHEMEFDLHSHTIRATVSQSYLHESQSLIPHMIRPILQSFILPFYGLKALHGAVLTNGKRTVFLGGRGGTGKTTSAIQLMRAGYDLLSDDGPLFFTDNGSAYALSSLDFVHVTENTLRLFPELCQHVVGNKDHRDKFAVPLSTLQSSSAWTNPHQVTHYIQLHRRPDVDIPRIKPVNRNLVHRNLINESMVVFRKSSFRKSNDPFHAYSECVFDLLTKVIRGAQTYELEYSDQHLEKLPEIIDHL
jgi:hypothetical protein